MRFSLSRKSLIFIIVLLFIILVNRVIVWTWDLAALANGASRQLLPLLLMAAALGADAMSLSVGIGLRGIRWREVVRVSLVIGIFHVGMPLIGAAAGHYFGIIAGDIARWLGAGIVAFIGARMIKGCLGAKEEAACQWKLAGFPLIMLATGVSIDALSVGFSMGAFGYSMYATALTFGIFSAVMSAVGLTFGNYIGKMMGERCELIGGCVLIILAVHMLFEG